MKLKQIVCDMTDLTLTVEKKVIPYGKEFEVSEERAKVILAATFKGQPVAELVEDKAEEVVTKEATKEDKPKKKVTKKNK